jgi:ArsR family transcriptional regulator
MAFSKAKIFSNLHFEQALWSKALGHPARIQILDHLLHHGTTPFYELRKLIPLASTTVSQHLRILRNNDLIEAVEICPHTYYQLRKENCKHLASKIKRFNSNFLMIEE